MNRRESLIALFSLGAASGLSPAWAQQQAKVWRLGYLRTSQFTSSTVGLREGFIDGMRKLGYVEGRDFVVEWRFADGDIKRFPELAASLVQVKVDLIVSSGTPATMAASKATSGIPIVLVNVADPVASGVAKSLARPGGNVTGVADLTGDLGPKNLEYLVGSIPGITRVAVLFDPAGAGSVIISKNIQAGAKQARVMVEAIAATTASQIDEAYLRMKEQKIGACIVAGGNLFTEHIRRIVELSVKHRLPTASTNFPHVFSGALLSYGADHAETNRRVAYYVDRIFKGAKPADLPIEQPTKFELAFNLKTAKALDLVIPPVVLAQANKVIE